MGRDPDVQLLKPRLHGFFDFTHGLPILWDVFDIDSHSEKLILVKGTPIEPAPAHRHRVRAGSAKALHEFIIRLEELLLLDGAAIVKKQREKDFEPDHAQPLPQHRWPVDS